MASATFILRNLGRSEEYAFEELEDALQAAREPHVSSDEPWAVFSGDEGESHRTPLAVGRGPFGLESSTIVGCRATD